MLCTIASMRALLLLGLLIATSLSLPSPASAQGWGTLGLEEESKDAPAKPEPRGVLRFDPHRVASPQALLEALWRVDWWITNSARLFTPDQARAEILEVHLDLLEDWLTGLDTSLLRQEVRETHFDPAITFTERVFLTWDIVPDNAILWQQTRDQALDDLRLQRPAQALARYRNFREAHIIGANPDQVLLFLRHMGAARVRAGGPAWRQECLALYRQEVAALLGEYPQFQGMSEYGMRSGILETLYEAPTIRHRVWRIRALLDLLTASGSEGYQTLLDYQAMEGEAAFLPYPEKVALDGGGLGLPLLRELLDDPTLPPHRRKGLLAVALEHAQQPVSNSLTLPRDLLKGKVTLYPYSQDDRAWLEAAFRDFLLAGDIVGGTLDPVFVGDSGPKLPTSLRQAATLLLELADPLAEVDRLLESGDPSAQAVALATLSLALEEGSSFAPDEWLGTEEAYNEVVTPFLEAGAVPELRDLALLVLTQLAQSPMPLQGTRAVQATTHIALCEALVTDALPARADLARVMALSWYRRGIGLDLLREYVPAIRDYAAKVDATRLSLDAILDLLAFARGLDATAEVGTSAAALFPPEQHLGFIDQALDRMSLFHRVVGLEEVMADLELLLQQGMQLSPATSKGLIGLLNYRESLMIHPDVALAMEAMLAEAL